MAWLLFLLFETSLAAAEAVVPTPPPKLGDVIVAMIAEEGPLLWEENKGWGDQVRIFQGLKLQGKPLESRLVVKKKPVNHGLWRQYKVWVEEPRRDLKIDFPKLDFVEGEGVVFTLDLFAHMKGYADLRQYNNGVRLFSAATHAEMDVHLQIDGVVRVQLEAGKWAPDLLLAPKVTAVRLELPNIDIERFGKLKGKLARETGDSFRKLLEDLLNDKEEKLRIR